ncbi:uncharacterized protein LOC100278582 [Zea mays]|uniref:uncharacterized protein LOC100278582 n=1 Tax=Zea mays TaxID=4577 RepID=UPI000221C1BA|nr:uncharacterized protein LOC100278582 [Zea mays]
MHTAAVAPAAPSAPTATWPRRRTRRTAAPSPRSRAWMLGDSSPAPLSVELDELPPPPPPVKRKCIMGFSLLAAFWFCLNQSIGLASNSIC